MAQRHEEETEFKVPSETLTTLCINNCGFSGNPSTKNMCQNCFKASSSSSKPARSSSIRLSVERSENRQDLIRRTATRATTTTTTDIILHDQKRRTPDGDDDGCVVRREVNRCSGCRRKVGLTGFRCRCGDLFCSEHRYSDRHDCSYDYKAAGRDAIARENPVVKAAKIVRL